MLHSMTGFGRVTKRFDKYAITVEVRSLNSRNLDLKIRIPSSYREREIEVRRLVDAEVVRGKVDLTLDVQYPEGDRDGIINRNVFLGYHRELSALAEETGLSTANLLYTITRLPNVLSSTDELVSDEEWEDARTVLEEAIAQFRTFREHDGEPIEKDFLLRIGLIMKGLEEVGLHEASRIEKVRQRLRQNLEEWVKAYVDENRLEQELIFYLEKYDITEEKVRLRQHCDYFLLELNGPDLGKSRKLGFIAQEIGREVNTIGSKANSAEIQRIVVGMKDELEKIKEQLSNVL